MKSRYRVFLGVAAAVITGEIIALLILVTRGHRIDVMMPMGTIASQQRDLIITALALMLIVIIPVFVMAFTFIWRYREGNRHATYRPDWASNRTLEAVWWGVPIILIGILSVITWRTSHSLDPFRPISSDKPAITIQAVALDWKWLFIYPDQNIATVNYVAFPEKTPVNFRITSDAPMNSFWIPQLGGQVYAMAGMETQLNLMASTTGAYAGSSSNLSGKGFAGMRFTAKSLSDNEFEKWVNEVRQSPDVLDAAAYEALAKPSENHELTYYGSRDDGLYQSIIMQYMAPKNSVKGEH